MEFRTPRSPVEVEHDMRRSRFIAWLAPVVDEDAARAVIAQARVKHPQARHHCTAFVVGDDLRVQRSSDDGEPSGTAGRPILESLLVAGLGQVVCVVTRYFGGVLLGVGGLTRAYRQAAASAIDAAELITVAERHVLMITVGYADVPLVQRLMSSRGWIALQEEWGAAATLQVALVDGSSTEVAISRIQDAVGGRASVKPAGTRLVRG